MRDLQVHRNCLDGIPDGEASTDADVRRALAAEVDFLLRHPGRNLSPQQRRLLLFLFEETGGSVNASVSQIEIATQVLGQAEETAIEMDSRARVAMQRLRSALDRFYQLPTNRDRSRLFLPKGQYRLEIAPQTAPSLTTPHRNDPQAGASPAIAWTMVAHPSAEAVEQAYSVAGALSRALARAPLVQDGALDILQLNLTDREDPFERAVQRGATLLVRIAIRPNQDGDAISLQVYDATSRDAVGSDQSFAVGTESDPKDVAEALACALVDPLLSPLPGFLAQSSPRSRLAVAMTFFQFMATQDRARLPRSLEVLQQLSATRKASPLTDALRIDAIRASYCFATSDLGRLPVGLVDEASRIRERAPYQPYATLAQGYIELAARGTFWDEGHSYTADPHDQFGSLKQDFCLLYALSGKRARSHPSQCPENATALFFENAAGFISSMAQEDYCGAEDHAFAGGAPANFWTRAFQAAIASERRCETQAKKLFGRLCHDNPGAPDYLTRAMTTMIPNGDIGARLARNLSQLS